RCLITPHPELRLAGHTNMFVQGVNNVCIGTLLFGKVIQLHLKPREIGRPEPEEWLAGEVSDNIPGDFVPCQVLTFQKHQCVMRDKMLGLWRNIHATVFQHLLPQQGCTTPARGYDKERPDLVIVQEKS